ncbi:ABC transporter permease [Lactococcus laudensis]|uniref:ABC transporter permease n=1 Tax=Pseudolactococcus laudensis TaxID=1494461 RepID=UPI002FC58B1C
MNLRAVIKNAYQALRQNTRRSILTMLGIVIGIASVITILSLGRGFKTYTVKNLTATNEKNVAVDIVFSPSDYEQFESNKMRYFSDEDLKFIGQIEGVEKVAYVKADDKFLRIDLQAADKKISKNLGFVAGDKDAIEVGRTD